jgi:hypothetical protein
MEAPGRRGNLPKKGRAGLKSQNHLAFLLARLRRFIISVTSVRSVRSSKTFEAVREHSSVPSGTRRVHLSLPAPQGLPGCAAHMHPYYSLAAVLEVSSGSTASLLLRVSSLLHAPPGVGLERLTGQ